MDPLSPLPVFISLAVALAVLFVLVRLFRKQADPVKFASIDGLRGYLAFFVFLHHSSIYYFFVRTGRWEWVPSRLYMHFGSSSVFLFFMITSFLFFTKLIDGRHKPIGWTNFFVSRVLRLYPVYLVVLLISIIYILFISDFTIKEPLGVIAGKLGHRFLFSMFGFDYINYVYEVPEFTAGVLWSLRYEWLFYFTLPVIGFLFFKSRPSILTLIISAGLCFIITYYCVMIGFTALSFTGGIVAAFLARSKVFCKFASSWVASLIVIACFACTIYFFIAADKVIPLTLISVAFILIACGNSLFGLLTFSLSREFGQLSYCIYLLHGVMLYALFHFCMNSEQAAQLPVMQYWLIIAGTGGILTALCFFLHHYYEHPALKASPRVSHFLKNALFSARKKLRLAVKHQNTSRISS